MNLTAPPPERTALIVLGAPCSGLSAMAGMLGHRGVAVPSEQAAAGLVALNDRLLGLADLTWQSLRRVPAGTFDTPDAMALLDEAVSLLDTTYADAPLFVMADPRLCRLLPFWRIALAQAGARCCVVLVHRAAAGVAASLSRRADIDPEIGLILWARHLLDAEADSRDLPRSWAGIAALHDDADGVADRIAADLGIVWPRPAGPASVVTARPRDDARCADTPPLPPLLARLDGMLQARTGTADPLDDRASLDSLRAGLDAALQAGGSLLDSLARRSARLRREVTDLQAARAADPTQATNLAAQLAEARTRLAQADGDADRSQTEIDDLSRQLAASDRQLQSALVQLRRSAVVQAREMGDRLQAAVLLDDPTALQDDPHRLIGKLAQAISLLKAEREDLAEQARQLAATQAALDAGHDHLRAGLVEARDHALAERDLAVAERERLRTQLTQDCSDALAERDAARTEGARREAELMSSTSWRVTAPLRALGRAAGRLRR